MSSGAFLTSESSRSNRPSIFTLLAAEGLSRTIQPALEQSLRQGSQTQILSRAALAIKNVPRAAH